MFDDLIGRLPGIWLLSHCWWTCPANFELAWHRGDIPKGTEPVHPNVADLFTDTYLSPIQ